MLSLGNPSIESSPASIASWISERRSRLKNDAQQESSTIVTDLCHMPYQLFGIYSMAFAGPTTDTVSSKEITLSGSNFTCLTCRLNFEERVQQQEHFKSDWHIANIKRKMMGEAPISEHDFCSRGTTGLKFAKEESDSDKEDAASDTSDSDDTQEKINSLEIMNAGLEEEDDDTFRKLFSDRHGKIRKIYSHSAGPQFVVEPNGVSPFRFIFSTAILRADCRLSHRDWSYSENPWADIHSSISNIRNKTYMAVIALRSGRFAGAIFNNQNERNPLVVHKVIRRYTVRAKAGGGQSSHDSKHGKAKSMGAQLRRYGEQMLQEDVERLLTAWVDYLAECSVILVAATKTMRSNLFEKEEATTAIPSSGTNKKVQLLQKADPRVVFVPFAVDKPTLEAVQLIRQKSLSVIVTSQPESADPLIEKPLELKGESVEEISQPLRSCDDAPVQQLNDLSEAEAVLLSNPRARRILTACEEASDETAFACLNEVAKELGLELQALPKAEPEESDSDDNSNGDIEEGTLNQLSISRQLSSASVEEVSDVLRLPNNLQDLSSPLHLACERNLLRTARLLFQLGANPEQLDARGRTAYFLSKSKEMRDLCRRMRGELGEERWQWNKTGIPEAITDEKIAQQKQKEKEKKKRAQQRKKEQKSKMEQQVRDAELARTLQAEFRRQEQIEREARMRQAAGDCAICKKALFGQEFFDVFEQRCCSTNCVQSLKRKLAADAAAARFGKSK